MLSYTPISVVTFLPGCLVQGWSGTGCLADASAALSCTLCSGTFAHGFWDGCMSGYCAVSCPLLGITLGAFKVKVALEGHLKKGLIFLQEQRAGLNDPWWMPSNS